MAAQMLEEPRRADATTLVQQLSADSPTVRTWARDTLVIVGEKTLPALVNLLDSHDAHVRWEAVKAMAEIAGPESTSDFLRMLDDPEPGVRWLAATGLVNLGYSSVPAVLRLLAARSVSKSVRAGAHHVLHDLSKRNTVLRDILKPVMEALGEADPQAVVPAKAAQALEELGQIVSRACGHSQTEPA
jgi:HEAT repeat protein